MRMRPFHLLGLMALVAATLNGQPTTGAAYWSTAPPDCSSLAGESPVAIVNSSGKTIGYSCYVSGTFVWLAAGGGWGTSIRVAAPASAAIGVDYTFYDTGGNNLNLDTTFDGGSSTTSGNDVNFALSPNQPSEAGLLGATSDAPKYASTATGSVYAVFYGPDAITCANVVPQLLYSGATSVPVSWDTGLWTQWSAEGIDDGGTRRVSLAIYNEDTAATSYTVRVYDSTGSLAGTGTTPTIPPLQTLGNGSFGEGGTYGALLSDVITTRLPPGVFKILVDGGSKYSAIEVLQLNGLSATALQVAYDSAPGLSSRAVSVERMNVRSVRVASTPKRVFSALEK
jgi:hypothetical protein